MRQHFIYLFMLLLSAGLSAQVGINTPTPHQSAVLDLTSSTNDKGFLPPRLTTAQRDAIESPATGLLIYNSTTNCLNFYTNVGWNETCGTAVGVIGTLVCANADNTGTLVSEVLASGVSSSVPYTGGNGGTHHGQMVTSTGVTGLTATLTAGSFATGAGDLIYNITGTPASGGIASFALNIGGQTCTLELTVAPGSITTLTCASAVNSGTLVSGVLASGVSSSVPYTGGNGGTHVGQTVTSTGVTGLTATLAAGSFVSGAGNLTYNISGTPASSGTASFALNIGGQMCTLELAVAPGSITTLTCASAVNTGTLVSGVVASGVSSSVPYTGGNGGTHAGQTVTSTGVTGLTATLAAGSFGTGAGDLIYNITGTPASGGIASFALSIGGQTCNLVLDVGCGTVTFMYNGNSVTYGTVGSTGNKCWLDRNLGATQVATSSTDAASYGDLFQWGRGADGHQVRNPLSGTTTTLSSTDIPGHGNFIIGMVSPYDWRSPQNNNLWQGVSGINNPCPSGYRVPTEAELNAERTSWSTNNAAGAFATPLKLPMAGYRSHSDGSVYGEGSFGYYWSSSVNVIDAWILYFYSGEALIFDDDRAFGFSVRCLKD